MASSSDPSTVFISERAARLATVHIAVTSPLLALGVSMFIVRIWIRIRPTWRVSWEDYVMFVGVALAIVDFSFLIPQMQTSAGPIPAAEAMTGQKYSFLAIPIWGLAMTFIKVSIAMTLLRIQPKLLWWRIFCGFIMSILIAYGIGNTFFILLQCQPLEASWNSAILQEVDGSCLGPGAILIASNTGSGVNISTDILLSLAPIMFLWKLKRPLKEKVVVGMLMSLGLFASGSSVVKTLVVQDFGKQGIDFTALSFSIATWTALEQLLAMIAASAPFLKPLLQSVLRRLGFDMNTTSGASYKLSGWQRSHPRSGLKNGKLNDGIVTTKVVTITNRAREGDERSLVANNQAFAISSNEEIHDALQMENLQWRRQSGANRPKSLDSSRGSDQTSWVAGRESTGPVQAV